MLIVEGPDGAGKTTLVKLIQEVAGIPVAPRVVSKETKALVDMDEWVDRNLEDGFQWMMFDRHRLISEPIYAPIIRSHQNDTFTQWDRLWPRMARFYDIAPLIIYCLPSLETVRANVLFDPDNVAVASHIDALYASYVARSVLDKLILPHRVFIWDYEHTLTNRGRPIWLGPIIDEMRRSTS